jgi:hypothetical protein
VLARLVHHGPIGWAVLIGLTMVVGRPALLAAGPRLICAIQTILQVGSRVRFRLQWRWRIPAIEALAESDPALRRLTGAALGEVAGTLIRTRIARTTVLPCGVGDCAYVARQPRRGRRDLAGEAASSRVIPTRLAATYPRGTVLVTLPTS